MESFNRFKDMYLLELHSGKVVVIDEEMDTIIPDAITKMQSGHGKQQAVGLFKNSLNKSLPIPGVIEPVVICCGKKTLSPFRRS